MSLVVKYKLNTCCRFCILDPFPSFQPSPRHPRAFPSTQPPPLVVATGRVFRTPPHLVVATGRGSRPPPLMLIGAGRGSSQPRLLVDAGRGIPSPSPPSPFQAAASPRHRRRVRRRLLEQTGARLLVVGAAGRRRPPWASSEGAVDLLGRP